MKVDIVKLTSVELEVVAHFPVDLIYSLTKYVELYEQAKVPY